jgi:hypothetical protein
MCNVIFLSKITPIYFTLFTNGMCPSIQCKKRLGTCPPMGEVDRSSLVFIDFDISAFKSDHHRVSLALEFPNFIPPCGLSHTDRYRPQRERNVRL